MRSIFSPVIELRTNRLAPTGGVIKPMFSASTIMIPACTGFMPIDVASAPRIGPKFAYPSPVPLHRQHDEHEHERPDDAVGQHLERLRRFERVEVQREQAPQGVTAHAREDAEAVVGAFG